LGKKQTYTLVITKDPYDKHAFNVDVPEILGCHTFGRSRAHAIKSGKEVIRLCLESEDRTEHSPSPAEIVRVKM